MLNLAHKSRLEAVVWRQRVRKSRRIWTKDNILAKIVKEPIMEKVEPGKTMRRSIRGIENGMKETL